MIKCECYSNLIADTQLSFYYLALQPPFVVQVHTCKYLFKKNTQTQAHSLHSNKQHLCLMAVKAYKRGLLVCSLYND